MCKFVHQYTPALISHPLFCLFALFCFIRFYFLWFARIGLFTDNRTQLFDIIKLYIKSPSRFLISLPCRPAINIHIFGPCYCYYRKDIKDKGNSTKINVYIKERMLTFSGNIRLNLGYVRYEKRIK